MSNENGGGEKDGKSAEKDASSVDSAERENVDEVPRYEGQWAVLSDEESPDPDGDSDGSSDSAADDSPDT